MWFMKENDQETTENEPLIQQEIASEVIKNDTQEIKRVLKPKVIPLYLKNACSILEVFTVKPPKCKENKLEKMESGENTIAVVAIMIFLLILAFNAVLDVIQVKEEERARLKLNPDGERRQSLAEFANKKTLRRESSKFGLQLFQIAESFTSSDDEKKNKRQTKTYTRGDSINSYLSDRKSQGDYSAPASVGDTNIEPKLIKRQSVAKLFGMFKAE